MKTKIVLSLFLLMILISCKKQVPESKIESGSFLKGYIKEGNQTGVWVKTTSDHGYLLFSQSDQNFGDMNSMNILKLDAKGKVRWEKNINNDTLNGYMTELNDGIVLCNIAGTSMVKITDNGEIGFKVNLPYTSSSAACYPLVAKSSKYPDYFMTTLCDAIYSPSLTTLCLVDPSGKLKKTQVLNSSCFVGKVLSLYIYNYEDPDIYYFYGITFDKTNWSWTDYAHYFVTKIQLSNGNLVSTKTTLIDPTNETIFNRASGFIPWHTLTPEGDLILCTSSLNSASNYQVGYVTRVDKDLKVKWRFELPISGRNIEIATIMPCSDGNYLCVGDHLPDNKLVSEMFMCKIDGNGKVLSTQYFPGPGSSSAWFGRQTANGEYLLTGTQNSFGGGLNLSDAFFIKTDLNGVLK